MTKLGYSVKKPKQCRDVAGKRICGLKQKKTKKRKNSICST